MMLPLSGASKPPRHAMSLSKARVFVGQLEPYVTEADLYPVFSCYGRILYLNVVRHSTTVTPNEERRIPTAFVWYETTAEADAAIAALHNVFTFSSPDEEEGKKRYIQVSYADKSPRCTPFGKWQKKHAETQRHPYTTGGAGAMGSMGPQAYSHSAGSRKQHALPRPHRCGASAHGDGQSSSHPAPQKGLPAVAEACPPTLLSSGSTTDFDAGQSSSGEGEAGGSKSWTVAAAYGK